MLSTPFDKSGLVDFPALGRLLDFLLAKDIGGLWVLGTGSEDMNLVFNKRVEIARFVSSHVGGRVPLVLGAGFFAMEDILDFMDQTSDLVADAFHVMPYHTLLSFDRLAWFYETLANKARKPLWMYTSANWSKPFTPDFVEQMRSHPNIAGVKFSTKDTVAIQKVATMASDGFQVITAVAGQLHVCLCMGSPAHTSSLGSAMPEVLIRIRRFFLAGEHEHARALQARLNAFLSKWPKRLKNDNFLQAAQEKYILFRRGICDPYTSSYYSDADEEEKALLDALMQEYEDLFHEGPTA